MSQPIADLSYRNYDGPLQPPAFRWWAIARAGMRQGVKKRFFALWACLSAWFYVILLAVFYFVDVFSPAAQQGQPAVKSAFLQQVIWKDQFLNAFGRAQLFFLILALLIGVGQIANDNRANALLVYLSKPCSRMDYIIGKWLSIFIPITLICAIPTFLFYGYCGMTYRSYGFFTEDPWLFVKLCGMVLIPGTVHASLSLGVSSLFNQGRLAGATYAGVYFFTYFFTTAMEGMHFVQQMNKQPANALVAKLYYASIDGIQIGMAKVILGTDGSSLPGMNGGGRRSVSPPLPVPAPEPWLAIGVTAAACLLGIYIAWSRVRAVEVVA